MLKFKVLMNAMKIQALYYDCFKGLLFGQSALEGNIEWYCEKVPRFRIILKCSRLGNYVSIYPLLQVDKPTYNPPKYTSPAITGSLKWADEEIVKYVTIY